MTEFLCLAGGKGKHWKTFCNPSKWNHNEHSTPWTERRESTSPHKGLSSKPVTASLIIARTWKQPKRPSEDKRMNRCGVAIEWNSMQP